MYYSLIGTSLTVLIGILGSYLTQDPKDTYDAKLLHPLVFRFCQRFMGEKPYYVKEIETVVGSNGNISSSVGGGNSGAKINHGFEAQNETNIIIDVGKNDKEKNPMEVIFTKSFPNTTPSNLIHAKTVGTATKTGPIIATTAANNDVTNVNCNSTLEISNVQNIFSTPSSENQLTSNDVTGSYRQIAEKENV